MNQWNKRKRLSVRGHLCRQSATELRAADLERVCGGAAPPTTSNVDWATRDPYLSIRNDSMKAQEQAWDNAFQGLKDQNPGAIVNAARDWAQAREDQQWAEQNLNYINHRYAEERQEQLRRAEAAELDELERAEQEAQEKEEEQWLEEAEDMLKETDGSSSPAGGADAGVPANAEPYTGELPSFPAQIANAPPSHTPQIIIEPIETPRLY